MRRVLLVALGCALAAACARALPPPGGPEDRSAPRLISTSPGPLEVIDPSNVPVVFRFDETLSERGFSETLVVVSPLDGTLRVDRSGQEIRVRIDGGWRPDRVYRVTVLPGVRDRAGNERGEPAEIVFSTGPPVPNTAMAGLVLDRTTGRAARNAVVQAVRRADSVAYLAVGDTGGFYALRHLPMGTYDVTAWADQNRNRRLDRSEARHAAVLTLGSEIDTLVVEMRVLAPDSTPPAPATIVVVDSLTLRVTLDDYLPEEPVLSTAGAEVRVLPDSSVVAQSSAVMTADAHAAAQRAVRDSAAADSAAADSAGVRAPQAAPPRAGARTAGLDTGPLPVREVVIVLDRPLRAGRHRLELRNFTNINGVTGGGSLPFEVTPPARVQPAAPPPDSTEGR